MAWSHATCSEPTTVTGAEVVAHDTGAAAREQAAATAATANALTYRHDVRQQRMRAILGGDGPLEAAGPPPYHQDGL